MSARTDKQRGMTLVEMMIAMLIGSILVAGAITVFVQSRANYRTADSIARLQDNLRFALDTLESDIRLARFWGLNNQPGRVRLPAGLQVSCTGAGVVAATDLAFGNLVSGVEARDDVYNLPCTGTQPRGGSDVLILRHASARTTVPSVGQVQVESNPSGATLFDGDVAPGLDAPSEIRDVVFNAYYVGQSGFDPQLPALRRLTLVDGGAAGQLQDQEVIPGVENLQVQFGLDSDDDMVVDRYVDSDNPLANPAAGMRVLAVRLWLMVRGENNEAGLGFTDNAVYLPPDADLAPIQPGVTPGFPAEFRRLAASKTIFLRNAMDLPPP
jgi:type IV pilus assembly protein PilW